MDKEQNLNLKDLFFSPMCSMALTHCVYICIYIVV